MKSSDKHEKIIRAAVKVFAKKGFFSARISDIAKAAKVADGTIYLYFNNKFDIYFIHLCFAAITFAFYTVLMRKTTGKFGNLVAFTIVVIFGTIGLGLFCLFMGIPWFAGISTGNMLPLLYLGVLGSGITFVSYFKGMELTSTNVGSIVFFFKPIQGTIYAIIILNERLTTGFIIGASLIVLGSVLMIYGKEKFPANF